MRPKRDYDPEALGVEIMDEAHAGAILHNVQDRASLGDEAERYTEQLAEDANHPAYPLRDEPDTAI